MLVGGAALHAGSAPNPGPVPLYSAALVAFAPTFGQPFLQRRWYKLPSRMALGVGFASQAESTSRDDGLVLHGAYIGAAGRCAPPDNKPLREELARCRFAKEIIVVDGGSDDGAGEWLQQQKDVMVKKVQSKLRLEELHEWKQE